MVAHLVYEPKLWNLVAPAVASVSGILAAVIYADISEQATLGSSSIPVLQHLAGTQPGQQRRTDALTEYFYPAAKSYKFALPFQELFNYNTEALSHTRSLTFLKKHMGGPFFDLEAIWDEHTYYEFADRSVEHTMSTMVQEPYVNHVPTVSITEEIIKGSGYLFMV